VFAAYVAELSRKYRDRAAAGPEVPEGVGLVLHHREEDMRVARYVLQRMLRRTSAYVSIRLQSVLRTGLLLR
jgi:hypothetical protein